MLFLLLCKIVDKSIEALLPVNWKLLILDPDEIFIHGVMEKLEHDPAAFISCHLYKSEVTASR